MIIIDGHFAIDGSMKIGEFGFRADPDLTSGLVAYYEMDDLTDSHINGYDGVLRSGSVGNVGGIIGDTYIQSSSNRFGGIEYSSNVFQPNTSGSFTMNGWFKISQYNSFNGDVTVIGNDQAQLYMFSGNYLDFRMFETGLGNIWIRWTDHPFETFNVWKMITLTKDAGSMAASSVNLYVDGELYTTTRSVIADTLVGNTVLSSNFDLGGGDVYKDFWGSIDEVGVWDRALTPSQITKLYNSGSGLLY